MLTEDRRKQLDNIVGQMVSNKESDSNIRFVVDDFKKKYEHEQEVAPVVKGKSTLRKVGDFLTSSTQKFGTTLGEAAAVQSRDVAMAQKSQAGLEDSLNKMAIQIAKNKKLGKDTRNLEEAYKNISGGQKFDITKIAPSISKKKRQIFGEAIGTGLEALSGGLATRSAGTLGAKTVGQALTRGALRQIPESGITGAVSGISQAMQEGKGLRETVKAGITGAGIGSLIGGVSGGLSTRSKFLAPEQAAKIKLGAVEQYKKGLQATKEKYKEKTEKIIPQLLDQNWWGTRKNLLKKAETGINLNQKEYEQLGELVGVSNIKGITSNIDKEMQKLTLASGRVSSVNTQRYNALKDLKADILAVDSLDKIKDNTASQQKLRELAQSYGKEVYETRRAQKTISDNKTLSQVKKVDGMIREMLNKDPRNIKYAEINKAFHVNSELAEILEETAFRKEGHKVVNIIRALSGTGGITAGALTGGLPGMLVGGIGLTAFTEIMNSTWWNTMRAVQKNKLAEKLLTQSREGMSKTLQMLSKQGIIGVNKLLNK